MKVYVVTSLIENAEIGAEVNVISIEKNRRDGWLKITELLKTLKEEYEENEIDYHMETFTDEQKRPFGIVVTADNDEVITLEYQESEVE